MEVVMKTVIVTHTFSRFRCATLFLVSFAISFCVSFAQQPASNSVDTQRDAMRKLSFLAGHWSGPVTIVRGPGEPITLTQTEDVEYKLDGLVLLIEGKSMGADNKVAFSALATIAYDDSSHGYRVRAYNDGHYIDTELAVLDKGFRWGFTAGPARILNTMHLNDKDEWSEVSEVTVGSNPPHRSVDMLLRSAR
jgi:hypothetical protein